MRKAKNKPISNPKNQPLNINISFNINPKNILHQEGHSDNKFMQNGPPQSIGNLGKNRQIRHKKWTYDNHQAEGSQKSSRKVQPQASGDLQGNKKELQKIKKKFLNKINNMDIMLELPQDHKKEEYPQEEINESSLMSAKMVQYENNITKKSVDSLQLNFNAIPGKSKMMSNQQASKVLSGDTNKRYKNQPKSTERKLVVLNTKNISHYKGYSTFTDIKGSPEKYKKKRGRIGPQSEPKKTKAKEENLQQKLERFKLDMMKLAMVYDQGEILKTKLSSQYYNNIRSREISKDVVDVQKINQVEQHEKIQEIKSYQAKKVMVPGQASKQESESFKNLKQIYREYNIHKYKALEDHECTENIVEYYTQIATQKRSEDEPVRQISEIPSDSCDDSSNYHPFQVENNTTEERQQREIHLEDFVRFLQRNLGQSAEGSNIGKELHHLLQEYTKQSLQISKEQLPIQSKCQEKHEQLLIQTPQNNSNNSNSVFIDSIDGQINKEITSISNLKNQLIEICNMNGDQVFQLEIWEENYKSELLKIKGKMWKEYRTIKNMVENRIIGNDNEREIKTRKTKKQNKIMKCLSERLFQKAYLPQSQQQTIQQLKADREGFKSPKLSRESGYIMKQEHLSVEPSISDNESDEQNDFQIMNGLEPTFVSTSSELINSKISSKQKEESILMNSLVRIEMDEQPMRDSPCFPQKFACYEDETLAVRHKLTDDDKQDIFQFIFLDLCIELYQQAIQKEQQPNKQDISPAERILKRLKVSISQQKKKKTADREKKIGIPTNVNTIKQIVHQINRYIMSDIQVKSTKTNRQRVIQKLNLPLGPSQKEILRSLRLSLYNNQPVDDYGQDMEEADLLVLEPDLFLYFQNEVLRVQELPFPKYYEDQKRDEQRINFLRNCTHIHQKAIFDCINQNLDYHRIYGIWGKPFLWKKSPVFNRRITESDLEVPKDSIKHALNQSANEVVKCAAYVCGLMVNKQDSLIKDIAGDVNYVKRLQDQRIFKLLENFVLEMEEKWFFHDDEESEILVELSHIVWTLLVKEVIRELLELAKS